MVWNGTLNIKEVKILFGGSLFVLLVGCALTNGATQNQIVETIYYIDDCHTNLKEDSIIINWKFNPNIKKGYNVEFELISNKVKGEIKAHFLRITDTSFVMKNLNADSRFHKIYVDFENTKALDFVIFSLTDTIYQINYNTFTFNHKSSSGNKTYVFTVKE